MTLVSIIMRKCRLYLLIVIQVKYLVDEQSLRKRTPTNATNKGLLAGIQDGLKDVKPLFLLPERPKAILVFSIQFFGLFR